MKLPFLPVHILTTKTLDEKLKAARDQVEEIRENLPLQLAERRLLESLFEKRRLKKQVQVQAATIRAIQQNQRAQAGKEAKKRKQEPKKER